MSGLTQDQCLELCWPEEAKQRIAELARRLEEAQQRNAAHDAKVAAEAKAEALEEAKAKITDAEYFFPKDLAYLSKKLDEWAAEYRAKAAEAGRKE